MIDELIRESGKSIFEVSGKEPDEGVRYFINGLLMPSRETRAALADAISHRYLRSLADLSDADFERIRRDISAGDSRRGNALRFETYKRLREIEHMISYACLHRGWKP